MSWESHTIGDWIQGFFLFFSPVATILWHKNEFDKDASKHFVHNVSLLCIFCTKDNFLPLFKKWNHTLISLGFEAITRGCGDSLYANRWKQWPINPSALTEFSYLGSEINERLKIQTCRQRQHICIISPYVGVSPAGKHYSHPICLTRHRPPAPHPTTTLPYSYR